MEISFRHQRVVMMVLLLFSGILSACAISTDAGDPGRVHIDQVDVRVLESFPVQVEVLIQGSLSDTCSKIDRIDQHFDADVNTFWIDVTAALMTDLGCAQDLVLFEEAVALDVYGLPAGTYLVSVNGTKKTFTLQTDNAPPESELPNPAAAYCEGEGYGVDIRTDNEGNQYGVCVFPDGSECDEWAFFRGDCAPDR